MSASGSGDAPAAGGSLSDAGAGSVGVGSKRPGEALMSPSAKVGRHADSSAAGGAGSAASASASADAALAAELQRENQHLRELLFAREKQVLVMERDSLAKELASAQAKVEKLQKNKADLKSKLREEAAARRSAEEQARDVAEARAASAQQAQQAVDEAAEAGRRAEAQARDAEDARQAVVREAGALRQQLQEHVAGRLRAEAGERDARTAIGTLRERLEAADAAISALRAEVAAAQGRHGAGGSAPPRGR